MLHTLRMDRDIPLSRRVELVLPDDFPTGEAELVVVVVPKGSKRPTIIEKRAMTSEEYIAQRRDQWLGHDE